MAKNGRTRRQVQLIVAAAIVLVAVAATVIILINDDGRSTASGTLLKYDVTLDGEDYGIFEKYGIGQSYEEYFFRTKTVNGAAEDIQYRLVPKDVGAKKGARMIYPVNLKTIDGEKSLEVWEYISCEYGGDAQVRAYVDPINGLEYKFEVITSEANLVYTLKEYRIDWTEQPRLTFYIGTSCVYASVGAGPSVKAEMECAADCDEGRFGVKCEFDSGEMFFISDYPHGIPRDAKRTGETATLATLDGNLSLEIWKYENGGNEMTFYYCSETNTLYRFTLSGPTTYTFDLIQKARVPR
jgi:hypothetical protein